MSSGVSVRAAAISRIGQRRQDFVEVSAESGRLQMRPKRLIDIEDAPLSATDAAKVRRGEAEIAAGRARPWRMVRDELDR
jgi:hypothetical protein